MVTENAPAAVVAVNDLQIVVIVPGSGRLSLIERPRTSYWYAYEWPEIKADSNTIDVCYTYGSGVAFVDIDCTSVKWLAFILNVLQGIMFLCIVFIIGKMIAYFAASLYITFLRYIPHSAPNDIETSFSDFSK